MVLFQLSSLGVEGYGVQGLGMITTWTPKVCKIMAFTAVIMGLGLLFCILLGFRYSN